MLRLRAACEQDEPTVPGYDVWQIAIDRDYAHRDVEEQLARYRSGRAEVIAYLKDRAESDWQRRVNRAEVGWLTLEALAVVIPLHDSYHAKQIVDWRRFQS